MIPDTLQREQIYTAYHGKVTGYVWNKIANKSDTEDIVADVFLKVYRKLDSFDESKASLSTWIYHITQNTLIDYYRKNRAFAEIPETIPTEDRVEDALLTEDALERLADGLALLEERERRLIILHYYNGVKLKDIAEQTGISYIYAKVLHKKALEQLKKYLQ